MFQIRSGKLRREFWSRQVWAHSLYDGPPLREPAQRISFSIQGSAHVNHSAY